MKGFEQFEKENHKIVEDMRQLNETEGTRLAVITSIFIRDNNEMRLQNLQDVKKDISYGAKDYGQTPEKYNEIMNEIINSYIEEADIFMNAYNDEFLNIQNKFMNAEEKQKIYFAKIREVLLMKRICELAEKQESEYAELDKQLKNYRKKLGIYEKIIMRCDKEFEECKHRRSHDFFELFKINEEQSLVVVKKQNIFEKIIFKIKNIFNGYNNFSKYVLQKHIGKINRIKNETMNIYINEIKKNINNFDLEINNLLNA